MTYNLYIIRSVKNDVGSPIYTKHLYRILLYLNINYFIKKKSKLFI